MSCVSPNLLVLFKKLFGSLNETKMEGLMARNLAEISQLALRSKRSASQDTPDGLDKPRCERVTIQGDVLSYAPGDEELVGMYIAPQPLSPENDYFEIEILGGGMDGHITVGLCSRKHPLDLPPGWTSDSVGYYAFDGRLYKGRSSGVPFGPTCECGDRMGCGIKFNHIQEGQDPYYLCVPVFFTKNGKEVGTSLVPLPVGGFFPSVTLHTSGEVRLRPELRWAWEEDVRMAVDGCEEDWPRLHDVRLNGNLLEYIGRGKSIVDVGLAQAKAALDTTSHYFEIQIVDPGENCYIAIGLARRDYPIHRHPGWNKGSIAYHADDGKIFVGSGVGDPFGPACHKGDIMGCGILFPPDYTDKYDSDESSYDGSPESPLDLDGLEMMNGQESESESGEDEWWNNQDAVCGRKVQVFFTRNGQNLGKKEVRIPKGGFYPTIGMLSVDEKVRVDLHPLTG